jgi:hypothetical protein
MTAIKIENFGGEIPAVDDRLLPDSHAADAFNSWLFSGRVEPMHALVPLYVPKDPACRSWFRLPKGNPGIDYMTESYWLEFQNQNVRVIRSPVAGQDDDGRYYWADGLTPKMMTGTMIMQANAVAKGAWSSTTAYMVNDGVTQGGVNYTCIQANTNQVPPNATYWIVTPTPYLLGIPAPEVAPGVTVTGGTTPAETRTYVYTWVSGLGEEGPPSPPATVNGNANGTWTVTVTAPQAGDTANRNLTKTRIYRTVTSQQGVATYYFVTELPITTLTFADTVPSTTVVNQGQMTSLYFTAPPTDLQQLVSMPNGMVAGFRNNEIWFCEPYYPHAWPVPYVIAVPNEIVGLGVFNQSLIILCNGQPYAATGVDPSQMALAIVQPLEACTSILSIVNTPTGVLYSSPNGLINITPGGAVNLTLSSITKDQWPNLIHLNSIAAAIVALGYYAYSIATAGVFQNSISPPDAFNAFEQDAFQQASVYGTLPGIYQKLDDKRIALAPLQWATTEVQNIITDLFNGEVMVKRDDTVYLFDLRQAPPVAPYRWRSKVITLPFVENLGAAKVYWIKDPTRSSVFRVFAGGYADLAHDGLPLRFQQSMTEPGQMFRLPSGYKALFWQFEVEGTSVVTAIHAATSARDLRNV